MVVTLTTSALGGINTRPSNPYQYVYVCGKQIETMDSLKKVTIILILVDLIFLLEMFFFSIPFLIFRCVMSIIGYWCLYMSAFRNGNPKIMKFFIFNQFIDGVYAIFMFILIPFIEANFNGNPIYGETYRPIEVFVVISSFITVCFKTCFIGYYTNFYKFLLWNQENINSIIATYTSSNIFGNNIYPNSLSNILITPRNGEILQNIHERPPLPKYNDIFTDPLPQKVMPLDVVENTPSTTVEEQNESSLSTSNEQHSNVLPSYSNVISSFESQNNLINDHHSSNTVPVVSNNEEQNNEEIKNLTHLNNENKTLQLNNNSNNNDKLKEKKPNEDDEFEDLFR
uniref:Transmembrane protein n=1 Tax=Strongyloides stercoralis TaxID=6248 RepID=A0A0K0E328_STRER